MALASGDEHVTSRRAPASGAPIISAGTALVARPRCIGRSEPWRTARCSADAVRNIAVPQVVRSAQQGGGAVWYPLFGAVKGKYRIFCKVRLADVVCCPRESATSGSGSGDCATTSTSSSATLVRRHRSLWWNWMIVDTASPGKIATILRMPVCVLRAFQYIAYRRSKPMTRPSWHRKSIASSTARKPLNADTKTTT